MKKSLRPLFIIIIMICWLMPVSREFNTLNDSMLRNSYIVTILILFFEFIYENKFDLKQVRVSASIIGILFICTTLTLIISTDTPTISFGYLLNYLPFCILINIKPEKLSKEKFLDKCFIIVCFIIIGCGILTVLNNSVLERFLKTYYIIHYPHIYNIMWKSHKTVTFFGTHSIACYIYFILWWLVDYRRTVKKGIINYILIAGLLFNIIMCQSVSSVLCIGIIFSYYYVSLIRKGTKKTVLVSMGLFILFLVILFYSRGKISSILNSSQNGILGRYGSDGNLKYTLMYAIKNFIPLGICDIKGLWLTDGGFFIYFIRGGLVMMFLMYYGLYNFLTNNIPDRKRRLFLFFSLLLFEVGYQFIITLRFYLIMLYAVAYYSYLNSYKNEKNGKEKGV